MIRKILSPMHLGALCLALAACGGGSNPSSPPAATGSSKPSGSGSSTGTGSGSTTGTGSGTTTVSAQDALKTATPIKHLVVIFGENRSFDHYFGLYPNAANPLGEPAFTAKANTPAVVGYTDALLTANPNSTNAQNLALTPAIPASELNPFRIDRAQANTAGMNHSYTPEQMAYDKGAMDAFPANTGNGTTGGAGAFGTKAQVLGYFDGNTVTAMWNYAQNFALNDNAYTGTFGPSTPGALEVVSGQTNGAVAVVGSASTIPDAQGGLTLIGDTDPAGDVCSSTTSQVQMTSKNIGDLLNSASITWGGFAGGFNLQTVNTNGSTGCSRTTYSSILNSAPKDYVPHHIWFQYYASTANPTHARPSASAAIGSSFEADGKTAEPANHQYDSDDFFSAVSAGNFPSVSYIKAPSVGDAHPGNSDPLDEQAFVTKVLNFLQQQPDWKNTAVIITYDDSDGWYDHRFATPTSASFDATADQLTGSGQCTATGVTQPAGVNGGLVNGRCGPGTRVPFLVISPWAKVNFVDDTQITQASVVRFIEDNWLGGKRIGQGSFDATAGSIMNMFNFSGTGDAPKLFLDPTEGTPLASPPAA
jgi:phospholipase C